MPFTSYNSGRLPPAFSEQFGRFLYELISDGKPAKVTHLEAPFFQTFGAFIWSVLNGEQSLKYEKGLALPSDGVIALFALMAGESVDGRHISGTRVNSFIREFSSKIAQTPLPDGEPPSPVIPEMHALKEINTPGSSRSILLLLIFFMREDVLNLRDGCFLFYTVRGSTEYGERIGLNVESEDAIGSLSSVAQKIFPFDPEMLQQFQKLTFDEVSGGIRAFTDVYLDAMQKSEMSTEASYNQALSVYWEYNNNTGAGAGENLEPRT